MKTVSHSIFKTALIVASIFATSLASSSGDESEKVREAREMLLQFRTEQLKEHWPKILGQWRPVAVARLDSRSYELKAKMASANPIKLNETSQLALRELLERAAIPADGYHAGCFYPTHAVIFRKDEKEFQLLIDFHCGEIATLCAVPKGEWRQALKSFPDEVKGYLNGLLDAAAADTY